MSHLSRELLPLKGKTVFVTGVSRRKGIGYAIARQAAAWGASIAIHHYQPHDEQQDWGKDDLKEVIKGIRAELIEGAFFFELSGDFFDPDEPERVMAEVSKACRHIDALICNHAMSGSDGALGELTAEKLDAHFAVNTRSSLLLAQSFAAQHDAEKSRGRIVFMTSGQRLGPMPGEVAYAASKGALADITLTLSDQLAQQNILVNAVNPGPVNTGYLTEESWKKVAAQFPLGRFGEPEDPARLIVWLLIEEASWITGQILNTEGGFARWL